MMNLQPQDIQPQLQDYCSHFFPEKQNLQVRNLKNLNQGWESIIYQFELRSGPPLAHKWEQLILRIYPGEDAYEKSLREFEGMQQLHDLGYPVPRVFTLERENSPFIQPFVLMENVSGKVLWSVLDQAPPEQSAALLSQFCALFVQLHALDWRPFISQAEQRNGHNSYEFVDRYFAMIHNAASAFPDLSSYLPVLAWLEDRRDRVPCLRPAPIHWDFHPGNVILRPDGSMTVIDWTQIQVSEPRFDLGWTLLLAGAYAGEDVRELILTEYQQHAGITIEEMAFFDVANALKRLGSVMISLLAGADQMGMRPDAVENMRRDFPALRWVYDLMVDHTGIRIPDVEVLLSE